MSAAAAEAGKLRAAEIGMIDSPASMTEPADGNKLPLVTTKDAPGATHFVQTVDVEVNVFVDTIVETCWVGVPPIGVMVLVIG